MDGLRQRGIPGRRAWGPAALVAASVLASAVALGEGAAPDAGAPELSLDCGRLMACSDECGAKCSGIRKLGCLMDCKESCSKRGCPEAQAAFEELSGCMKSRCPFACAGGPTERCRTCGVEDCTQVRSACSSQRCADGAKPQAANDQAMADAGRAAADAGR